MTGLKAIERLRLQGFRPEAVFVFDHPEKGDWPVAEQLRDGCLPALHVAGEDPAFTDLRPLTGCRVHLLADDSARAVAWVDRLLQDGAAHVIQTTAGEVFQWRQ
jgi:hypothetical protein